MDDYYCFFFFQVICVWWMRSILVYTHLDHVVIPSGQNGTRVIDFNSKSLVLSQYESLQLTSRPSTCVPRHFDGVYIYTHYMFGDIAKIL